MRRRVGATVTVLSEFPTGSRWPRFIDNLKEKFPDRVLDETSGSLLRILNDCGCFSGKFEEDVLEDIYLDLSDFFLVTIFI
jgi:hypothetical protein